jgi:tetratricopeptide (TPR) repeat protein
MKINTLFQNVCAIFAVFVLIISAHSQKPYPGPIPGKKQGNPQAGNKAAMQQAENFFNEGKRLQSEKRYNEALAQFKEAVKLRPKYPLALYEAAWTLNRVGRYEEAIAILQNLFKLPMPANYAEPYIELGFSNLKLGRFQPAIAAYKKAQSIDMKNPRVWAGLGEVYLNGTGEFALAVAQFQEALKIEPKNAGWHCSLGQAMHGVGRFQEAVAAQDQALANSFDRPEEAYMWRGLSQVELKKNAPGIADLKQAITLNGQSAPIYFALADVYYSNTRQYKEAIEMLTAGLKIEPENARQQFRLGWCYNHFDRFGEALAALKESLRLNPDDVNANIEIGYSYLQLKQFAEALTHLDKAIGKDATASVAHYYKGLALLRSGRKAEAVAVQKQLLAIDPERAKLLQDAISKQR